MQMIKQYSYKDIVLFPDYSEVISRKQANCKPVFLGKHFNSVAIPANMRCTIDFTTAVDLAEKGYFYILHRFYNYDIILDWIGHNQDIYVSISVGVKPEDHAFIENIKKSKLRVDCITIDVAHGHHISVKKMIDIIRQTLGKDVKIIAGNIGTITALKDLAEWGADAAKVGLSMGKSCTTYNCTGVGTPMFSAVYDMCHDGENWYYPPSIPIIADGQIREVGDVCKALVAGASMVMIGSEFAKCSDSPAETTADNRKVFYGSASSFNKQSDSYIEGQKVLLDQRTESYYGFINRINEGVQSCMSYAGTHELNGLTEMQFGIIA